MGGEGSTEAGLEEAPGAGQGRAGKVTLQVEGLFTDSSLGRASSYAVLSDVSVAYRSYSNQWLFIETYYV